MPREQTRRSCLQSTAASFAHFTKQSKQVKMFSFKLEMVIRIFMPGELNDQCANCGTVESSVGTELMMCACSLVLYCSRLCQEVHWERGGHKNACAFFFSEQQRRKRELAAIPATSGNSPARHKFKGHFLTF